MFFLNNHSHAPLFTIFAGEQETATCRVAARLRSWLIKHQPSNEYFASGDSRKKPVPEAVTLIGRVKKCEVDVQMRRTPCIQQVCDYDTIFENTPARARARRIERAPLPFFQSLKTSFGSIF